MGIREWFYRWRATRGYGVHSPLAFRLVKNVVRPPRDVMYYGEERLLLETERHSRHDIAAARLLLRFVAEMQPATVWTAGSLPELYHRAISLAGCVVRIYDGKLFPKDIDKADMTVLYKSGLRKPQLERAVAAGKSLIGFDLKPSFAGNVVQAMPGGVVLEGRKVFIAAVTSDEAVHKYRIL